MLAWAPFLLNKSMYMYMYMHVNTCTCALHKAHSFGSQDEWWFCLPESSGGSRASSLESVHPPRTAPRKTVFSIPAGESSEPHICTIYVHCIICTSTPSWQVFSAPVLNAY